MDNNPGVSLFQGTNLMNTDFNSQQPEEIEAIEDEKRRNIELKEMLFNAFDDLETDDAQTIDNSCLTSTINEPVYPHDENNKKHTNGCYYNDIRNPGWSKEISIIPPHSFVPNDNGKLHKQTLNECTNSNQFEVLYQVRLREIEGLRSEISDLSRRLLLTQAETDKALTSKNEIETRFAETKLRIANLENENSILKKQYQESEEQKKTILLEKQTAEITIRDLEHRLIASERIGIKNYEERQFNNVMNNLNIEHKREISSYQKEIDNLTNKLANKEKDFSNLEDRFKELQKVHEYMLTEKSNTINRLANNLEDTQSKYENLLASDVNQDMGNFQTISENLRKENGHLNTKLKSIMDKYEALQLELQQYENLSKLGELLTNDVMSSEVESFLKFQTEQQQYGVTSNSNKGLIKLKEEWQRLIANQKAKRNEIIQLQEKLATSEAIIADLKNKESFHLNQINSLKIDVEKLRTNLHETKQSAMKLKQHTSTELSELKIDQADYNNLQLRVTTLEEDNRKLKLEISEKENSIDAEKKQAIDHYSKEYLKFHQEKISQIRRDISNDFNRRIQELESRLEENVKDSSEIKELYTEACIMKDKLISQNEANQKRINDLVNENILLNDQIRSLKTEKENLLKSTPRNRDDSTELLEKVSNLQSVLSASQNELQEFEQKLRKQFSSELNLIKSEKQALQNKITTLEKEIERWKVKLNEQKQIVTGLEEKLKEKQLKLQEEQINFQRELFAINLRTNDYVTKANLEHSEKMSELQIRHAELIGKLKIKHQKMLDKVQSDSKSLTMQAFDEEIKRLTENQRDVLRQLMIQIEKYENNLSDKLQQIEIFKQQLRDNDLNRLKQNESSQHQLQLLQSKYDEKSQKLTKTNENVKKMIGELQKLQTKYENSRKAAFYYKELAEKRKKLIKSEKEKHTEIQQILDICV